MKQQKMLNSNKGITLIALVITIIVMLILVLVTINMAVKGGLFGYAGRATKETKNAIRDEQQLASGKIKIGEMWYNSIDEFLNGSENKDIIVFYVNRVAYTAREGMTWEEWINSTEFDSGNIVIGWMNYDDDKTVILKDRFKDEIYGRDGTAMPYHILVNGRRYHSEDFCYMNDYSNEFCLLCDCKTEECACEPCEVCTLVSVYGICYECEKNTNQCVCKKCVNCNDACVNGICKRCGNVESECSICRWCGECWCERNLWCCDLFLLVLV